MSLISRNKEKSHPHVAVFDDNIDVVISAESAGQILLSTYYSSIDLNSDQNVLCMNLEEWSRAGELPKRFSLLSVHKHPILADVFEAISKTDPDAEQFMRERYQNGYPFLGFQDIEDHDESMLIPFLRAFEYGFSLSTYDNESDEE